MSGLKRATSFLSKFIGFTYPTNSVINYPTQANPPQGQPGSIATLGRFPVMRLKTRPLFWLLHPLTALFDRIEAQP
jgi:hypothetical protein